MNDMMNEAMTGLSADDLRKGAVYGHGFVNGAIASQNAIESIARTILSEMPWWRRIFVQKTVLDLAYRASEVNKEFMANAGGALEAISLTAGDLEEAVKGPVN